MIQIICKILFEISEFSVGSRRIVPKGTHFFLGRTGIDRNLKLGTVIGGSG